MIFRLCVAFIVIFLMVLLAPMGMQSHFFPLAGLIFLSACASVDKDRVSVFEVLGMIVMTGLLSAVFLGDRIDGLALIKCIPLAAIVGILGVSWARVVRRNSPKKNFNYPILLVTGWLFVMSFEGSAVLFFLWILNVNFSLFPNLVRICEILAAMAIPALIVWRFAEKRSSTSPVSPPPTTPS